MPTKGRPLFDGSDASRHLQATFGLILAILGWCAVAALIAWALVPPARGQNYESTVTPILALTNSAQSVKASPGAVLYVSCFNPNATATYVQFFDSAAAVVVGTTVPTWSLSIPPTSASGQLSPPLPSHSYYASAGMQIAAATTATGGSAPTSTLACDVAHR